MKKKRKKISPLSNNNNNNRKRTGRNINYFKDYQRDTGRKAKERVGDANDPIVQWWNTYFCSVSMLATVLFFFAHIHDVGDSFFFILIYGSNNSS